MVVDRILAAKLKKKYGNEKVLIVPYQSASLIRDKYSQTKISTLAKILDDFNFVLRSDAEYNQAFVQIIPYILIANKDHTKIYVTQRIAGEERLKNSYALGAGGHINPCDLRVTKRIDTIYNAAMRELNEELDVKLSNPKLKYLGTVRDLVSKTNEHAGVVYVATADKVKVKEKETLRGEWMSFSELTGKYSSFESWARLIIDQIVLSGSVDDFLKEVR